MEINEIPMRHGMEVEQDVNQVPDAVIDGQVGELGSWHRDGSGPYEVDSIGCSKQVKTVLKRFINSTDGHEWEWHNETSSGAGCGSHAHLSFEADADPVEGYTIAWNTVVELAPFLAPFWCADWEQGFRSSVSQWADPQTTRYAQSTVEGRLNSCPSRSYKSVTFNPPRGSKPMTIELRMNEAHPSFALVGLTFLRRTITKALRRGESPKLANRGALTDLYDRIYDAGSFQDGLVGAMKEAGPFRFEDGRGIPGSDVEEFDSAWDVLMKVFAVNGIDRGAYDDHVKKLIQAAGDGTEVVVGQNGTYVGEAPSGAVLADGGEWVASGAALGPQNNPNAVWETLDDDFSWEVGPEVDPR